jgi:tRNA pseudouridine32 synthase / 23S rRNA pseudouridine746 synthase
VVQDSAALGDGGRLVNFLAEDPRRRDTVVVVPKGGKKAVSDYVVTSRSGGVARLDLWPRTGRTHQLRVQCAHVNAPILGDRLYGDSASAARLLLHAASLELPPLGGFPTRQFHAPTPF